MHKYFINSISVVVGLIFSFSAHTQSIDFSIKSLAFSSSVNDEFAPVYYKNGLVFCSNSLSNTSLQTEEGRLFNILYVESKDSNSWKSPELFSRELTTILNEGPACFSTDEKTVYYARNNKTEGKLKNINVPSNTMGIYSAENIDGVWINIEPFPFNSEAYSIGTPALSPDDNTLFFASDMPGGYGGTDIYYSKKNKGRWQKPVNLGPNVNTEGNESYPFMNEAGQLFFASDGLPGKGGKDIFYTAEFNGVWQVPVHLGSEINSPADDYGFITDMNFSTGYFSSNRKHSVKIYSFKSERPQFSYCDTLVFAPQCFEFVDDRFTDTRHLKYEWNFGNGERLKGYQVKKCFNKPGDYEVVLTIEHHLADSIFETKYEHRFTVGDFNTVGITPEKVCLYEQENNFFAIVSDEAVFQPKAYYWNFGDGYQSEGQRTGIIIPEKDELHIKLGVVGDKNSYGVVQKKCFIQEFPLYPDVSEMVSSGEKQGIVVQNEHARELGKSEDTEYRLVFSLYSDAYSLLEKVRMGERLKQFAQEEIIYNNQITASSQELLQEIVSVLKEYPDQLLIIAVHADGKGSDRDSDETTQLLADEIQRVLSMSGIYPDFIQAIGYGNSRVLTEQKDKDARTYNRRVELILTDKALRRSSQ